MIPYDASLRFDPGSTGDKDDIAKEFCAVTGCDLQTAMLFLDHVLFWDEKIKLNRDREIAPPAFGNGMSERHGSLLRGLSHRLRLPGLNRAKRMEGLLAVIQGNDSDRTLKTVLDFGAGIGNDGLFFAANGYQVTCGELPSPHDDWIVRRLSIRGKSAPTLADIRSMEGRKFDVLYSMDVLEHVYDVEETLAKMVHWVRTGGLIAIEEDCFNVIYNNDHLEKNRFFHRKVRSYLTGFCAPVGQAQKVEVFRKVSSDALPLNEIKATLYRRTKRRALFRILATYALMPLVPVESLFWACASLLAVPLSGVLAGVAKKDPRLVRERLPNYLYQHQSYLLVDRFADAVAAYRIATDRLRKLKNPAEADSRPALSLDSPRTGEDL